MKKINVGLVGAGRLGRVYARDLAALIPETRLVAVADPDQEAARACAEAYDVPSCFADPDELISHPQVEAVVIVSTTKSHARLVEAVARSGKPIFCEKPLSISLDEALRMKAAVDAAGVFFQMGFMRRFDLGYAEAKRRIDAGEIGRPVVFKSSSRDPYRPSVEYADPRSSGGMIIDMGIHDFDLALWMMGPIKSVAADGAVLVYPELGEVGDIDNAVIRVTFEQDGLGVIDLSRKGVYGYDISTEVLGSEGAVRVGYLRETPLLVMRENQVSYDTVPYFPQRFTDAYTLQLSNFAGNLCDGKAPPVTIDDGVEALRVGVAATRSLHDGRPVELASVCAS